jgi:hypothetical protein
MRITLLIFLGILSARTLAQGITYNSASDNKIWAAPPKKTKFGEFKHFKDVKDNKTGLVSFNKQPEIYFALAGSFKGDDTDICYGASLPDKEKRSQGIACVLKPTKGKDCSEVDFNSCANDESIKPTK